MTQKKINQLIMLGVNTSNDLQTWCCLSLTFLFFDVFHQYLLMHHLQRSKVCTSYSHSYTKMGDQQKSQFGDLCYCFGGFFQPRTYVPINMQKIENLVFLFEIRSKTSLTDVMSDQFLSWPSPSLCPFPNCMFTEVPKIVPKFDFLKKDST